MNDSKVFWALLALTLLFSIATYLPFDGIVTFDATSKDAFNRLTTAQPYSQFESSQLWEQDSSNYDMVEIGTGASKYVQSQSLSRLIANDSADRVIHQSYRRFHYQTGKSQEIIMTFNPYGIDSFIVKRFGYFNSDTTTPYNTQFDGIYLELEDDSAFLCLANYGTVTKVGQANWNGNTMNTGDAKISWDSTILMKIQFQWLSVGKVTVLFQVGGTLYVAHEFKNSNKTIAPYMRTPTHSIRYEIEATDNAADSIARLCAAVINVGSINFNGKSGAAYGDITDPVTVGTTYELVTGIRHIPSQYDRVIDVLAAEVRNATNGAGQYLLVLNPTYNDTVTWTNISGYQLQAGEPKNENATVTDVGDVLIGGFLDNQKSTAATNPIGENNVRLGVSVDGTEDEIWLIVKALSTTIDVTGVLNFREY